ncbi:conserved hypothetical protein [Trichormus variabilis ATCC 29413]|uniref:DUF3352 domain-containing protein n=2 Tax=Anabaena variabilis TaxID=264691 RepID=Q3MCK0_TRIV2|nr:MULTISPECIES: DUF3352 domain-containing protein [Nostocaceae]ABA21286.1 conserved hypothetical protein [Trichormus variabilis ATCC 29413]MBC1214249.1 DUF3352 domain-containing protein [Trichormus variabilis ARAD]MBC1258493.1 DUF3352 domain-containing protein [Trichormus variabilis V5]MBC1266353.1 DUF3352 domain-containing protein [Trichormus variabilis FSR]MBC1301031.1 DUF3352 domain-containing protein [Trichormus variabilis N2B]
MNTQRSFSGFIIAGAIALIVAAIAGFYWFFAKSPVNIVASNSQPNAAVFISKLAPVTVSLLANPDKLQSFDSSGEISKLKTSLLAKSGIDYKQDIQPWLKDEITLAVTTLDIDRDPENGRQPGYLMALATSKPEKSQEFLQLLFSKRVLAGANLATEEYQGAKVIYDSSLPESDSLAGAVIDNFVLFANNPKVLRDAINNVQAPDLNLLSSSQYQKSIKQIPKGSLATAFLNLPLVAQWQGLDLPEPTYDSEIVAFILNPQGILAETSFFTSSEIVPTSPPLSKPVGALRYIPASAGLVISGSHLDNLGDGDLAKLWTQAKTAISGSGTDIISRLVQPLTDVQKSRGINLRQDIFSWVQGEYAVALIPRAGQSIPDWVFVTEKSENVPEAIGRLDAIASSQGLSTNTIQLDKQTVVAWTELTTATQKADGKNKPSFTVEAKVKGVHTTLGNYEIFTSDLATIYEVFTDKDKSLINNRNFQDSIATIPQPNQGYVYLDWSKSQNLVEQQIPILKLIELVGKPFFENLRSLTFSSYGNEPGTLKGSILFQIDH